MLVPKVTFNESNVGISSIRTGVRNRIAVIGQFSRGPANEFNYINGYSDFAARYGSDAASGSLVFQAAYDQGARDFAIVRVLGNGKPAYGNINFVGVASKANKLILNLKFVGQVIARPKTVLYTPIFTSGRYTGTINGRYYFYVSDVTSNNATIKYKFFNLEEAPSATAVIDWSTVSTSISVKLDLDQGVAKAVANGVSLKFGVISQSASIDLKVGQEWTVRVNSHQYITNIFKDALPYQVSAAFADTIQGANPLGSAVINGEGNSVKFYLDETAPELLGKIGEGYSYSFDLEEPDAVVKLNGSYLNTDKDTITLVGNAGAYIKVGATVSASTAGVVATGTTITAVSSTVSNGVRTTVVTLSGDLTITADGSDTFTFTHTSGLSVSPYTESSAQFFQGGENGPQNAVTQLFSLNGTPLFTFYSVSAGAWGNNVRLSIYPISDSAFRLSVSDITGGNYNPTINSEDYLIDLTISGSLGSAGEIVALNNSNLIRGIFLPAAYDTSYDASLLRVSPQRLAPADSSITDTNSIRHSSAYGLKVLQNISLEGGHDGPKVLEADYITALNVIKEAPVHIIVMDKDYDKPLAQSHAITIAENASELEGLKIVVLNSRPGLLPAAAKKETIGLDSRRGVMVAGWGTYSGQPNAPRFGVPASAYYAGMLATIPYYVSPSARTSAGTVFNLTEVDIQKYNSLNSLQLYTDGRLEILTLDPALDSFFFINGRTLSTSTAWDKIIIRRTYDIIRQDLYLNLQQYKSEPHTRLLRRQVASSINAYFGVMARNGRIANFASAICDDSNNPTENYTNGELNVSVSFLPLYSADAINMTLVRNSSGGLQIGA